MKPGRQGAQATGRKRGNLTERGGGNEIPVTLTPLLLSSLEINHIELKIVIVRTARRIWHSRVDEFHNTKAVFI